MCERVICYNKLWKILIDRKIQQYDFRKKLNISYNTFAKLRKDEIVSIEILLKICNYLDCNIGDIIDFVKTENDDNIVAGGETTE